MSSTLVAYYCEADEDFHDARADETGRCPYCWAAPRQFADSPASDPAGEAQFAPKGSAAGADIGGMNTSPITLKSLNRRAAVAFSALGLLAVGGAVIDAQTPNDRAAGAITQPARSTWSAVPDTQTVGRKITTGATRMVGRKITTATTSAVALMPYRR